ncbi:sorbitol dehydrogenase-like [Schistocerca nitens]|uniref:sorbitol dehydrogenase-like n=1 Tax=Schistocerca nitens TaxID=7011 RepID=UPI002119AB63|nr:sorbitol dehydrogenase-like [Schistocerca nitens]
MTAEDRNLSAVLYGIDDLRLEEMPIPEPKENEVLVRVHCMGICGSDVHFLKHGRIGSYTLAGPMVLGHEASGVVVRTGAAVSHLQPGDRVALEPGVPCRQCTLCHTGRYNLCRDVRFCACPPTHGALTGFFAHAADYCYKLPKNVSLEEGAMLEPLSVAIHACRRAGITLGSSVLIIGAGPIGLVTVLTAKAMGATNILITDLLPHRLEMAKKIGATSTLHIRSADKQKTVKEIVSLLKCEPHISIECSGSENGICLAVLATAPTGVVMLVGNSPPEVKVPLIEASLKEVDIRGIFRYSNTYPTALSMVASGVVDIKHLITHKYPLEKIAEAFEKAHTGEDNPIKIMIYCSDSNENFTSHE